MKAKVTNQDIHNVQKKVNSLYWKVENWINEVFIPYARIPVFIVLGFLVLVTADYIYYGNKKDITELPKVTQERYNSLIAERAKVRKNRWELEGQGKYVKIIQETELEIQKIYSSAPYASWGREVLNFIKEFAWNIKSN